MAIGSIITMFGKNSNSVKTNKAPMINSPAYSLNKGVYDNRKTLIQRKKKLMKWYKQYSPELTGLVNMVVKDILEEDYFEPIDERNGRNRIKAAENFKLDINLKQQDFSSLVDIFVTGEAYGWLGKINQKDMKERIDKAMQKRGIDKEFKELLMKINFSDEDLVRPQKYRYVASSTVENLYDKTSIKGFRQTVGAEEQFYKPEEMIHYQFYNIDGEPEGFSSVMSILTQLELLRFMWVNMNAVAKNGGHADRIFSVEDIDINSPAFKRMEQELSKYVKMQNRHGSLLLNGKVTVTDLQQLDQMQFKEMGLYIVGVMATLWSIPKSRISYILGGTNTKDDTGGNSEKAYWSNIEMFQDLYLSLQNKYLWIPYFGVRRKFKKGYKHDELVEAQTKQTHLNNLTFVSNELAKIGKQLKPAYVLRYLNGMAEHIQEEDIEDKPEPIIEGVDNSSFRQDLQSNKDLKKDTPDKQANSDKKKQERSSDMSNHNNPSGFGKENTDIVLEEKTIKEEIENKEIKKIPFLTFVSLYNEDKNQNKNPPRVFMSEYDGVTRFVYRSTDFVYESVAPSNQISKTMLMNFRKVYRIEEDELLEAVDGVVSGEIVEGEE